jgi:hypothetical protein
MNTEKKHCVQRSLKIKNFTGVVTCQVRSGLRSLGPPDLRPDLTCGFSGTPDLRPDLTCVFAGTPDLRP